MNARTKTLTEQIVVRVTPEQRKWLQEWSDEDGRTLAQSIRLLVKIVIERGLP